MLLVIRCFVNRTWQTDNASSTNSQREPVSGEFGASSESEPGSIASSKPSSLSVISIICMGVGSLPMLDVCCNTICRSVPLNVHLCK